jgi:hypothetical protein
LGVDVAIHGFNAGDRNRAACDQRNIYRLSLILADWIGGDKMILGD